MVWDTTQASLYRTVSEYNSTFSQPEGGCMKCRAPEAAVNSGCPCAYASDPKSRVSSRTACAETRRGGDLIGRLTSDKDLLLIAALMLVLMNEGADKKLILALAMILLG